MSLIDWDRPDYLELRDLRMALFQAGTPRKDRPSMSYCATGFPKSPIAGG